MIKHVNGVKLVGRLMNPNLRYTPNGKGVCDFTVYTEVPYGNDGKSLKEFSKCTAWGELGEQVGHASENDTVEVIGRNDTQKWQDKDGNNRWTTKVIINSFKVLESAQPAPANEPPEDDLLF